MSEDSAENDVCRATALLEQGHREDGLQALSSMLVNYADWLRTADGRAVYEAVQVQRGILSDAPSKESGSQATSGRSDKIRA